MIARARMCEPGEPNWEHVRTRPCSGYSQIKETDSTSPLARTSYVTAAAFRHACICAACRGVACCGSCARCCSYITHAHIRTRVYAPPSPWSMLSRIASDPQRVRSLSLVLRICIFLVAAWQWCWWCCRWCSCSAGAPNIEFPRWAVCVYVYMVWV